MVDQQIIGFPMTIKVSQVQNSIMPSEGGSSHKLFPSQTGQ